MTGTNDAPPQGTTSTETLPVISQSASVPSAPANPFERAAEKRYDALAQGAVAIEQERAIAEAQGRLIIAQKFPRDQYKAFELMKAACQRKGFAKSAFYSYPRGSQKVSGPTIRLAEELARCWGNVDYGLRELSNREGVSEMEAYAWDMERNTVTKQQFTVRHIRDRREDSGGARELTDQRDIYEITANMGARRMRARILAILPDDFVDAAITTCRQTLAAEESKIPMPQRIRNTVGVFNDLGVSVAMLEQYLGHALDATTPDELLDLRGVHEAIVGKQYSVGDYFGAAKLQAPAGEPAKPAAPAEPGKVEPPPATERKGRGRPPGPAKPATAEPAAPAAPANPPTPAETAPAKPSAAAQDAPAPKVAEPPPTTAAAPQAPAAAAPPASEPKPGPKPVPPPAGKPRELF